MGKSEFKVYYGGSFWGRPRGRRPSRPLPAGQSFDWLGRRWRLAGLYAGGAGLTADFCVEIAPESIRAFWDKWGLWGGEPEEPGLELRLNGKILTKAHSVKN